MRNHQSCSIGSKPFLEVNAISSQTHGREDMVMKGILDTIVLMVIIPQILRKRKPQCTTKSGVILRQRKWEVYTRKTFQEP